MMDRSLQASVPVRPGALTQLLAELARAPEVTGWELPVAAGEMVGRFQILREIGRGGFGVVYEARDTELARAVAFKALREIGVQVEKGGQLLAEAEAAARLAHPNIVHLYDLGRCERGPYLILELLHGKTLSEQLKEGPLPSREALRVCVEMAKGLAHAHGQGVVHRDVKPGNVFLCQDGQVKLLDFGMAHVFGRAGLKGGTPAYMAPEQAKGEAGDERSDVYALGVTLYQVLTGKLPFQEGERGVAPGGAPPEIPGAPAVLAKLVGRMLAREPAERPKDGAEALELLRAFQKTQEPRKQAWLAWSVAALALVAGGAFALRQRPLPPGRLLTAMADTENLTGDPDLDGVGELLRVGLEQSKRVSIMGRARLVNLLQEGGRSIPKAIGEAEARSAAKNAQAQLVVVPSVRQEGDAYDVAVRAVDLGRNEPLFALRELAGGKGSVPDALDRLTARIRKALHEDPKDAPASLVSAAVVASGNPEAWRLHAEGNRLISVGKWEEGRKAYEQAIAADPEFPLPRIALLDFFLLVTREPAFDEHLRAIRRNLHRVPPEERAFAEALSHINERASLTDELAWLDRAIEASPEDFRPYVHAGNIYLYFRGDIEAGRPYMEKAAALAPLYKDDVIDYLIALDRVDDALARTLRWTEASPDWVSFMNLSLVHRVRGEAVQALEAARRSIALGVDPTFFAGIFADAGALEEAEELLAKSGVPVERRPFLPFWLAFRGRLREAVAAFDAKTPPTSALAQQRRFHMHRASLMFQLGDPGAVYRDAADAFTLGAKWWYCSAWPLAILGDPARAERLASAEPFHDHDKCWRMYQAVRTWKAGDREAALRAFTGIYSDSSRLYQGEILLELGRDREAVEAFRRFRSMMGTPQEIPPVVTSYPRSLYLEATALERLGEREEARKVLGRLLHLWERADADLPLLREARALGRRLGVPRKR